MEVIFVEYFPNSVDTGINENIFEFHSYISDENEQNSCYSHARMFRIFKKYLYHEYEFLVCKQYGKTPMVVPINIGVLWIYI